MEYKIKPVSRFSIGLAELRQFRELFYFFVWRDVKVRYKQTFFGFLWAIIQPVMLMLTFSLVFKRALRVPSDDIPYPIFVYSGLLLWNIFSNGLTSAANSLISNARMVKKIYFPRLIMPTSNVLVSVFDFFIACIVFVALLLYYQHPVNVPLLLVLFPIAIILTILTTCGMGYMLAAWNVKYRDFKYGIPFLIQMLLFLNPIVYPSSIFQGTYAPYLMALNPIAGAINLSRAALLNKPVEILPTILISSVMAIFIFILGVYVFRKEEAYFADIV